MVADQKPHDIKEKADELGPTKSHLGAEESSEDTNLIKLKPPMAEGTPGEDIEDPRDVITPG